MSLPSNVFQVLLLHLNSNKAVINNKLHDLLPAIFYCISGACCRVNIMLKHMNEIKIASTTMCTCGQALQHAEHYYSIIPKTAHRDLFFCQRLIYHQEQQRDDKNSNTKIEEAKDQHYDMKITKQAELNGRRKQIFCSTIPRVRT